MRRLPATLSVPGNLLLLGEYAVLEEGGLGISIAVDRRVRIEVEPARELRIDGMGAGGQATLRPADGGSGLLGAVGAAVQAELESQGLGSRLPPLHLSVDSSALYAAGGRKLGLGSSAAVAAGAAWTLLELSGFPLHGLAEASFRASLAAHRAHQGGRGSGYDVAASLYGGYGLFRGGLLPSFRPLSLPWMPQLSLRSGAAPVSTVDAVGRYLVWKEESPGAARAFLEASNEAVRGFVQARDWARASIFLREGARLGIELGEAIGVPARIALAEGEEGKALGAGDELWALWRCLPEAFAAESLPLVVATQGALWS